MSDFEDFELERTPEPPLVPGTEVPDGESRPAILPWVLGGVVLAAAAVAAYILLSSRSAPPSASPAAVAETEVAADSPERPPLGGPASDVNVPPLDESDPIVRQLVSALSSHPRLAALLATDGLIRKFTVVVENIASGATPAGQVKVLAPAGAFRAAERGNNLYVDQRSYDRYNALAEAVASVDAARSARVYATLKPRIQEAYGELGIGNESFDRTLERAIRHLIDTPVPSREPALEPRGIGYGFVDVKLEDLSGAQKQLLRTGPRNMRLIQDKLREIGRALGMTIT